MAPKKFLALLFFVVAEFVSCEKARIVGGEERSIQHYPYVVQVEAQGALVWSQICAGSILTRQHVLSAAQCFSGLLASASRRRVRAGSAARNQGGVLLGVSRAILHPSFRSSTSEGDIAVVQLSTSFIYGDTIRQATIIVQDFELTNDLAVIQVGWGSTRASGSGSSSRLRDVTVYTVDNELCAETHSGRIVNKEMLCTGGHNDAVAGACNGDEGGPVIFDNIVVGVISWQSDCSNSSRPTVNTKVASYTNWIVINAQ